MSTSGEGCCFERQSVILRDTEVPAFWQAVMLTTAAIAWLDKLTSIWSNVQDPEKHVATCFGKLKGDVTTKTQRHKGLAAQLDEYSASSRQTFVSLCLLW